MGNLVAALREATDRGDYRRFRQLLDSQKGRLLELARRRLEEGDAAECIETAIELAFRRFGRRPAGRALERWLDALLAEAMRTRPRPDAGAEDHAA